MEIRISNLHSETTEDDVRRHFSDYRIMLTSQVKTVTDVPRTSMKTYCFISIDNRAQADSAIEQLNGSSLRDATITVEQSR